MLAACHRMHGIINGHPWLSVAIRRKDGLHDRLQDNPCHHNFQCALAMPLVTSKGSTRCDAAPAAAQVGYKFRFFGPDAEVAAQVTASLPLAAAFALGQPVLAPGGGEPMHL